MDGDSRSEAAGVSTNPKPCEALWFQGGDVVLAAGDLLFRVHKDVLSLQSSVFRDMFSLPPAGDQGAAGLVPEMYEGLPLVTLAGDKGKEVMHLLRTAYERRYYNKEDNDTALEVIVALLLLSTKYDFKDIRQDVVGHLLKIYPTTFRDFDEVCRHFQNLDFVKRRLFGTSKYECAFPLLEAAFSVNAEILLPRLFFACLCDNEISEIIEAHPGAFERNNALFKRLITYKERLSRRFHRIASHSTEHFVNCAYAHFKREPPGELAVPVISVSYVFSSWADLEEGFEVAICDECKASFLVATEGMRREIWDKLPEIFDLPSWQELLERNDS